MIRLIDANALIDAMYTAKVTSAYEAQDIINSAPTIEPKRGEWVVSYIDGMKQTECSACGVSFTTYDVYGWHYCPWCGARMKGADDED